MRRTRKRPRAGITIKLILALVPTLLLVLLFFGYRSIRIYQESLTEQISTQLQMQVDSAASQIAATLSEVNRSALYVYSNMELRDGLILATKTPERFTPTDRLELHSEVISPMFNAIIDPSRFTLILYPVSSNIFCDYSLVRPLSELPGELPREDMMDNGYARSFWHMASDTWNWDSASQGRLLTQTRVIYHADRTPLAMLCARVKVEPLEDALSAILPREDAYWYRCALEDGETVFQGGRREDDMLILSSPIRGTGAMLTFGVNYGVIHRQLARQTRVMILLTALMLAAATLLILLISSLVMRRLRGVLDKYRRLTPGQELTESPLAGMDEAALLDQTFSRLYRSYYESSRVRRQLEINQRMLENNLLLSRINPHFLYNTLSAIRWKLPVEYWEVVDKLVAFYREMLSKGRDITFLANELSLMGKYVDLQRFTYSKEILYEEAVEPGLDMLILPKFLLQPVFENAVRHGATGEVLRIRLTAARQEDRLILVIENNGNPIDEDTLLRLNRLNDAAEDLLQSDHFAPDDRLGYGVFNIITRLKLIFGEGYGLWYERPEEGGVRARFVLPACEHPEDITNWKKCE